MIEESRSIVLSDSAVLAALVPLLEDAGVDPDEAPTDFQIGHDDMGEITVTLTFEGKDPFVFDHVEAGRAILHHCIAQRIPLPRGSLKELALRGDQLALIVRIVIDED